MQGARLHGSLSSYGRQTVFRNDFRSIAQENRLDRHVEQIGYAECERQRGIIFAGLDRIDRLPRHREEISQILLAPIALGAQDFKAVFHSASPRAM